MSRKRTPAVVELSNPSAFSGQGSIIVVELPNEHAAKNLALKLAQETGRRVIVRNAEMDVVEIIAAPVRH